MIITLPDIALPPPVAAVIERLEEAGHAAFAVGGCLRDWLLGVPPHDWDIATSAAAEDVTALFPDCRTIPTGLRHGTVTLILDGMPLEITTFRADGSYTDCRRPDSVTFVTDITTDLSRRDFTVNAMAYRPGVWIDPFDGAGDCENRILRCVGPPEKRFAEDALRIMRCLRLAAVYGFTVEPETGAALISHAHRLGAVAGERLYTELTALLAGRYAIRVLPPYRAVLGAFLPLAASGTMPDTAMLSEPAQRMAAIYQNAEPDAALRELERLRPERRTLRKIEILLRYRKVPVGPDDASVGRWLAALGEPALRRLLTFQQFCGLDTAQAQSTVDRLIAAGACYTTAALAVRGGDLLALGLRGPELGNTLRALLDAVIDGRIPNERAALLEWVGTGRYKD